jgi:hypothetical protein
MAFGDDVVCDLSRARGPVGDFVVYGACQALDWRIGRDGLIPNHALRHGVTVVFIPEQ